MSESIEEVVAELTQPVEHGEKCELKLGLPFCGCRQEQRTRKLRNQGPSLPKEEA